MMKSALTLGLCLFALPGIAAVNVPLTVQEAIYPGAAGVARSNEPFCMGVPLADAENVKSENVLGLSGATAAQFRILGRWPSGNAKWVEVCGIVSSMAAGGTATVTLTGGSGEFGGTNLATDNGATITVSTGAATFTIRKANFNVIDSAIVAGKTIVASSADRSRGLVITGPDPAASMPAKVTCTADGACTTEYSSANDATSTCSIEKNGPVAAVIKCIGTHKDVNGNPYMQFTAREYFFKGKTGVKVTSILRNANYDTSTTPSPDKAGGFNTAFKGFESYELRVSPNLSGTLNYSIANHTASPSTGSLSGTDSAYVYQGRTTLSTHHCDQPCLDSFTTDIGYKVIKNGAASASGGEADYVKGWADISDGTGAGVTIGIYQMAGYWPKSLEFNAGGKDVRIGIWPRMNSKPVYQPWPSWNIHDLYLDFHASTPAVAGAEFLRFQHPLLARASVAHYNSTDVFHVPIVEAAAEDAYYSGRASAASPPVSRSGYCAGGGTTNCHPDLAADTYRHHLWPNGGGANQEEFRWSNLLKFLQRGHTGKFLHSAHFYRYQAEKTWPHADGTSSSDSRVNAFTWRSRPNVFQSNAELDHFGRPNVGAVNTDKAFNSWLDVEHFHWWGMTDFYFLTGDETMREAMQPRKDWYLNNDTYQGAGKLRLDWVRAFGIEITSASKFAEYLQALGDPDASQSLAQAEANYQQLVKPEPCISGYPSGCTAPPVNQDGPPYQTGISRTRGMPMSVSGRYSSYCNTGGYYRGLTAFQGSILIEGLLMLRRVKGPAWAEYNNVMDLAYGIGQWATTEVFKDDGTARWKGDNDMYNGFAYASFADLPAKCPAGTPVVKDSTWQIGSNVYSDYAIPRAFQGHFLHFYALYATTGNTEWKRKFDIAVDRLAVYDPLASEMGAYQVGAVIHALGNSAPVLTDVPFTIQDMGSGNYKLSWTVPANTQRYRIKWSPKVIAPSSGLLGFDALNTNTFQLSPDTHSTWFAANTVTEPAPAAAGTTQSITIAAGQSSLAAANFSVKAYVGGGGSSTTPVPSPAANLVLVSGNNQTGAASQPLANPIAVKVTSSTGTPVAGTAVTFTVSAGGGTVSIGNAVSGTDGIASTSWTLGATAGVNTVVASSAGLAGSPLTFTANATAASSPVATAIASVSGSGQSGTAGQALGSPFVVKVTDASGAPVSGVAVSFTVAAGGGSVNPAQASTDSQGLASTVLTLGPAAGTNTVTANSGSLAGGPITFNATATAADGGTSNPPSGTGITWTKQTVGASGPAFNGWISLHYDAVSQSVLHYGVPKNSTSIYSTDMFSYNAANNTWTNLGGYGSMVNSCTINAPDRPGDRHPYGQMAIDTKRNRLWMWGGANQTCNPGPVNVNGTTVTRANDGGAVYFHSSWVGEKVTINGTNYTVAAVNSSSSLTLSTSAGTQSNVTMSLVVAPHMYYYSLNADPKANTWTRVPQTVMPNIFPGVMAYDPDSDVLVAFGSRAGWSSTWVYCTVDGGGTLTQPQKSAGCVNPNEWAQVVPKVVGGAGNGLEPVGVQYGSLLYAASVKKLIQFGGETGSSIPTNETWSYDVPTKTWTKRCVAPCAAPPKWEWSGPGSSVAQPALAYVPQTGKLIYHYASGSTAPSDWEYDPVADTWSKMASTGGGPFGADTFMTYDPQNNAFVTWNYSKTDGMVPDVWQGKLSQLTSSPAACDLNGDGAVNVLDVQTVIAQSVSGGACSTGDLTGDGVCNETDVSRVRAAALGGACYTGK